MVSEKPEATGRSGLGRFFRGRSEQSSEEQNGRRGKPRPPKWSMGVLNDPKTLEVPGSVLLLAAHRNEPLGLRNIQARSSHSSIPTGFPVDVPMTPGGTRPMPQSPGSSSATASASASHGAGKEKVPAADDDDEEKKKTEDGKIILEPQPDDSANDPLNWPSWRRDLALLSLGIYCMIGGGITPLIAAGFTDVAEEYHVETETVALTTGLYMMGLGLGSVIFSPTAILWGKRPVYLFSVVIFIATSLWAGFSPTFNSLMAARVFQGIAVSPVECLPSATIAEIFFLHERAYRIGIYTLLLLGGKNLVPLVSAAIIGRFGWRWVFWITAMIVALCGVLLFLFVPETFWDRTPTRKPHKRPSFLRRLSSRHGGHTPRTPRTPVVERPAVDAPERPASRGATERPKDLHVGWASEVDSGQAAPSEPKAPEAAHTSATSHHVGFAGEHGESDAGPSTQHEKQITPRPSHEVHNAGALGEHGDGIAAQADRQPSLDAPRTPVSTSGETSPSNVDYFFQGPNLDNEKIPASRLRSPPKIQAYTHNLRQQPPKSFTQQLKPYHGRLNGDKWFKVMLRPFILFAYPAVLWSAIVYACSVGWLIVISETIAVIYRDPDSYNFDALQTGLVYVSPFIGGCLGTGVAGKISDVIVKAMSARNGGLYEPEFRLVMAIPILITTCIGLMGFGWSAQEKDHWIVPTVFFGVMSFGCSLGSTTSITFCVDSYRQYAGEALVTLNFSKNIFHGLVFSLFVGHWLTDDGPKSVFIWIGIIQLILLLFTIPLFVYGKRLRMWTVRMNFMEKF